MDPNVTAQVIEYLSKKGYSRTEAMLRMESANQDAEGRPLQSRSDESGGSKYGRAFGRCHARALPAAVWYQNTGLKCTDIYTLDMTRRWIDENLEIYKVSCGYSFPTQPNSGF